MERFDWKPEYSIGDVEIDSEHKWLLSLANEVLSFARTDEDFDKVKAAAKALYKYVQTHFQNEEAFMERAGYEGLADHRKRHQQIVNEMNKIMKQSKALDVMVYQFKRVVNAWALEHINEEDRKICQA